MCERLQTLDVSGSLEVTSVGTSSLLSRGIQSSLLSVDLTRTGCDQASIRYILSRAKRLRSLRADQNVWEELLNCCNLRYRSSISLYDGYCAKYTYATHASFLQLSQYFECQHLCNQPQLPDESRQMLS